MDPRTLATVRLIAFTAGCVVTVHALTLAGSGSVQAAAW